MGPLIFDAAGIPGKACAGAGSGETSEFFGVLESAVGTLPAFDCEGFFCAIGGPIDFKRLVGVTVGASRGCDGEAISIAEVDRGALS